MKIIYNNIRFYTNHKVDLKYLEYIKNNDRRLVDFFLIADRRLVDIYYLVSTKVGVNYTLSVW